MGIKRKQEGFNSLVVMKKKRHKEKLFILVEGSNDQTLFSRFFREDKSIVIPVGGKENVIEIIKKQNSDKSYEKFGIVDSDFDRILEKEIIESNIFCTDVHDVETMIIAYAGLRRVLIENIYPEAYEKLLGEIDSIIENILKFSKYMGMVRFYSLKNKENYKFSEIEYEKFINGKKILLDKQEFMTELARNTGHEININGVEKYIEAKYSTFNTLDICCGHDITNIMGIILNEINKGKRKKINSGELEKNLRLMFSHDEWESTEIYKKIYSWLEIIDVDIMRKKENSLMALAM